MENKTTKHTPGPWFTENVIFYSQRAKDKEWVEIWTHGPDGGKQNIIALSGYGAEGFDLKTQKANARLMAAAPELLESVKEFMTHVYPDRVESLKYTKAIALMRAAIAKAEGR